MTHEEEAKNYCMLASFPSIIPGTLSQKQIRFVLTWFVLDKPALAITHHLPVVLSVFTSSWSVYSSSFLGIEGFLEISWIAVLYISKGKYYFCPLLVIVGHKFSKQLLKGYVITDGNSLDVLE